MRLSDSKVRVVNPESGTAAVVRVLVEHSSEDQTWSTVGVSANIIEASWRARADGLRYFLAQSGAKTAGEPVVDR